MSRKNVYDRIKELSFDEMLDFLQALRDNCIPPVWLTCPGDCKECISMYLQEIPKEDVTYIYVLPNEEIRNSYHITLKKRLWGNTVEYAHREFEKTFPHIKFAVVLRKEFSKASDGTAVFDSIYKND